MKIEVVTRYSVDDPLMNGDYCSVEIRNDGKLLASYGDSYHDSGKEKAKGFIDAWLLFCPDEPKHIDFKSVADYQD